MLGEVRQQIASAYRAFTVTQVSIFTIAIAPKQTHVVGYNSLAYARLALSISVDHPLSLRLFRNAGHGQICAHR